RLLKVLVVKSSPTSESSKMVVMSGQEWIVMGFGGGSRLVLSVMVLRIFSNDVGSSMFKNLANPNQNHREEEDQEGNNSSEITTDLPWTVTPRMSREPRTSQGRKRAKSTAEALLNDLSYIPLNNDQNNPTQGDIGETSNNPTQAKHNEFKELYSSANEEFYLGCDYVTRLDFMAKFTYFKVKGKLTYSIFNEMLEFFQNVFPTAKGYKLPLSYYAIKKTFKMIMLGHTAKEMTWHATEKCMEPGKMQHPDDGRPWKDVDTKCLDFAAEPRNVRLGLAADGFYPFDNLSQSYSMWPVILTTYNLPPWLCMKDSSFMLTLLIIRSISPGKDIDVYLRPLIDDLKDLWAKPEAIFDGPILLWWMYPFEKYMKKLKTYVRNKVKPEGSIAEGYVAEETMTLSSHYFQDVTTKFNRPGRNVDCPPPTCQFQVFKSLCKSIGLRSVIRIDHQELKKVIWYVLHNRPEIDTYRAKFKIEFPNKDMKEEFPSWFGKQIHQCHVDNDPCVSESSELFALACGPSQTPISVNSCVVKCVRGVFVVEDDPDVIHVDNSSDLALSTSLNDLKIAALHIDGQSIDVDAPPDIIDVVNEDDDIIDGEDPVPHDLAYFDNEDLINLDIDDGVNMSLDVAWGHDGGGGSDDRKGTQKPNLDGRRAGRLHTRQETQNLGLKAITNKSGPVPIRFEFGDRETLMPLSDHAAHWANYLGEPVRELPLHYPFWRQMPSERKAEVVAKIGIEADDQAIQTILLGLPEDIYAAVDSCETAQEIWLRVQQMMKGSDIGIQKKKAKNKHFLEKIASNLKFLNNLQPEWSRHVTIVHQTKDLHTADYTQLYDFLKYNQKEVDELKAERHAKTQDPLSLMANSNNPYTFSATHQDQSSFNQNYLQQPTPNPEDITDPTTSMNMALSLMAKAFKLNYSTPTNNNQRISSNPRNRQIAQPGMNMGQDRQMQMIRGNGGNQFRQYAGQNTGNLNGYNAVQNVGNQVNQNPRIQNDGNQNQIGNDHDEIKEVNANCILMANLQQASSSDTQTDCAPVYDSDGSAE
nr:hypothetical protein [Tanacetum cinerariifolium]